METLVKKNNEMVDGILFLKGNGDQLSKALLGVVTLLGYDIYNTEMLTWKIKHRMGKSDKISVPVRTDNDTWRKIKNYTAESLIAAKEKVVAC